MFENLSLTELETLDTSDMSHNDYNMYQVAKAKVTANEVMDMINSGTKTFSDDHRHTDNETKLEAIVELDNGHICPVRLFSRGSLNMLYVSGRDGKIHVSTRSVGATYGGVRYIPNNRKSYMTEIIKEYNETVVASCPKITSYRIL